MESVSFDDKNHKGAVIGWWGTSVFFQGKSPVVNGKLRLQPNELSYARWKHSYQAMYGYRDSAYDGMFSSYSTPLPTDVPINETYVHAYHSDIITLTGNKFHDEVAGIRVNLLDLYRTRVEAANMVRKNALKLVHAYNLLKKGKFRQFQRTLGITAKRPKSKEDNIPSLWLEYSYGWAPLLSDTFTMLDRTFEVPSAFVRKVYRKTVDYSGEVKSTFEKCSISGTITCRGVATAWVSVDVPAIQAISQYGVTNPLAVAWEAVPFSFVVDWFAPIGDFINSLGATAGLSFSQYNITSTVTSDLRGTNWSRISRWDSKWASANSTFHYKSKFRIVPEEPEWLYPGNDGPLNQSMTRVSYALSLIASVFGSKR